MPDYTFATQVPNIVAEVYATSDTDEETNLNTEDTAADSVTGVLTLDLDVGDYYAKWRWQGDTHTTNGEVAAPAGAQSPGELAASSGVSGPVLTDRLALSHANPVAFPSTGLFDYDLVADDDNGGATPPAEWTWDDTNHRLLVPAGLYAVTVKIEPSAALTAGKWVSAGVQFGNRRAVVNQATDVSTVWPQVSQPHTDWVIEGEEWIQPLAASNQAAMDGYVNMTVVRLA